jgi:uncharacterized protein (TIGR02466 family)
MPLETWFPTIIYFEDLQIEPAVKQGVLDAVRARADRATVLEQGCITADNSTNDLHLDPRVALLFAAFRPSLCRFFFEHMQFDPAQVEFHVGRCWPVVQIDNGYAGRVHHHEGGAFSAVFYLQTPPGSGALEFYKPVDSPYDSIPKTASSGLTYRNAVYQAVEHRLIVFSSDLKHRRLSNTSESTDERIAISFDIYTATDIGAYGSGLPRIDYLRKLI